MVKRDTTPFAFEERLASKLGSPLFGRVVYLILKLRGVELPRSVQIGDRLRLPHGAAGLVVHPDTRIGDDVKLYQGVTIGRSDTYLPPEKVVKGGRVSIDDNVLIGANAVVLFRGGQTVTIGSGAVIGAGSVVLSSVPAGEIWAGSPARRVGSNARSGTSGSATSGLV